MPWKETSVLDARLQFIAAVQRGEESFTALCARCGISRPTGYTLLHRYQTEGAAGLVDRSRAPHTHPHAVAPAVEAALLALRDQHPAWGPVKLRQYLCRHQPAIAWPAPSTIGALLDRHGRVAHRPRRRPPGAVPTPPLTPAVAPNHVWAIDFKGWFATGDGQPCYPLTLTDTFSRYLLCCQALAATPTPVVQALLTAAFREYGLPAVIRSDNGPPFASTGLAGVSRLMVWWVRLGIRPERIAPGRPQQNGRHERFHRTLQDELTHTPAAHLRAQQRAFRQFQHVYNTERPHAALDGQTPADLFVPSPRPYPRVVPPFTYPEEATVRLVHTNGCIKWQGDLVYVSEALCGERIALTPLTTRHWQLWVGAWRLALYDEADSRWLTRAEARRLLVVCGEEDAPA